jgi:hypothetical protein
MESTNLQPKSKDYSKEQIDFLKFRAEEYERRNKAMTDLEWKITFQLYTAYGALALASTYLHDHTRSHAKLVGIEGMVATMVVYCVWAYLSLRIQERLRYTRDKQNLYLDKLHDILSLPQLRLPSRETLKHQYKWAPSAQWVLSSMVGLGLCAYNAARGGLFCF